jgi:Gas vesicle protein K
MNMNTSCGVSSLSGSRVASPDISDFATTLAPRGNRVSSRRMNLDEDKKKNGLAQLVLTVIKLLHELLEKQAIRRIDGGGLTDEEIERLGFTLMRQSEEIRRISSEFGLGEEDLNLDLGPLGKLL